MPNEKTKTTTMLTQGPLASLINRPVETAGDLGTKGENSAEPTVNHATRAKKLAQSGALRTVLPFGCRSSLTQAKCSTSYYPYGEG